MYNNSRLLGRIRRHVKAIIAKIVDVRRVVFEGKSSKISMS